MKAAVRCLALAAMAAGGVSANQFVRVAGELEIPVPAGWHLASDTSSLPAQLVHCNDSAEILIFRSELGESEIIANERELRKSVDLVVDDVIEALPGGQLRVSTGFYDQYRTGFVLEFASLDSLSSVPLEHSIKGVIYRTPDQRQILFTIWGKAAGVVYPAVKEQVRFVQDNFAYRGEYESEVFAGAAMSYWPLAIVAMGLLGLLLLRPRRKKAVTSAAAPIS
ncbi:MAG: hypothetical protein AB1772_04265 [Candidatus Zixiibacteriota bacterium]